VKGQGRAAGFFARLEAAARQNKSLLCVGLDPDPERMPARPGAPPDVAAFNRAIIEATADLVCAYKPNLAFYEALGEAGMAALADTLAAVPPHIPTIGDAKRGDVGHTARAYAQAMFDGWGFDAVTVNPYLGGDALAPFLERDDRGVFVLCRTSNPGAAELQDLLVRSGEGEAGSRPLFEVVAERARAWNSRGNVGLVVGATYPEELGRVRELCPQMTFLVPGVGAQGGDLEASLRCGLNERGGGLIISVSRQVAYASREKDFARAARRAAQGLRDQINRERDMAAAPSGP
jgi:orotidine-5'-phosphate decarboxylase